MQVYFLAIVVSLPNILDMEVAPGCLGRSRGSHSLCCFLALKHFPHVWDTCFWSTLTFSYLMNDFSQGHKNKSFHLVKRRQSIVQRATEHADYQFLYDIFKFYHLKNVWCEWFCYFLWSCMTASTPSGKIGGLGWRMSWTKQ